MPVVLMEKVAADNLMGRLRCNGGHGQIKRLADAGFGDINGNDTGHPHGNTEHQKKGS
jgi:hypothetical protein